MKLHFLYRPLCAAPFITFRFIFGAMMVFSAVRFWALGWIEEHLSEPKFHFKYYGFEWVEALPLPYLYAVYAVMIVAALGLMWNIAYRLSAILLFLTFTYTELIDLTYYLNHYYFVSLVCFLLIFVPKPKKDVQTGTTTLPFWAIWIFRFQLAVVYFYAGIAKINYDWLILALPLKIWLPANDKLPLIGYFLKQTYTAYFFAWAGMLYDCLIVFFLSWKKTRLWAYATVIFFHTLTGLMFQIGVFPLVMMGATLIFFSDAWHLKWQKRAKRLLKGKFISETPPCPHLIGEVSKIKSFFLDLSKKIDSKLKPLTMREGVGLRYIFRPVFNLGLIFYLIFQLLFPFRYLLYDGNLFWTEEGYRFSWRVMLMEKAGTATFYVKDSVTGREGEVVNREFLNSHQEKQMAMQPDMILQFAHFLKAHYEKKGVTLPQVRAEVYVTLNARPSRLLIDPNLDLVQIKDSFAPKTWILSDKQGSHK
jgi:hypothetical protein